MVGVVGQAVGDDAWLEKLRNCCEKADGDRDRPSDDGEGSNDGVLRVPVVGFDDENALRGEGSSAVVAQLRLVDAAVIPVAAAVVEVVGAALVVLVVVVVLVVPVVVVVVKVVVVAVVAAQVDDLSVVSSFSIPVLLHGFSSLTL